MGKRKAYSDEAADKVIGAWDANRNEATTERIWELLQGIGQSVPTRIIEIVLRDAGMRTEPHGGLCIWVQG